MGKNLCREFLPSSMRKREGGGLNAEKKKVKKNG
jgi:hypothetical protein